MHVELRSRTGEVLGTITLRRGRAVFDEGARLFEKHFVFDPERKEQVLPKQGKRYLPLFARAFRTSYLSAVLVE